MERAMVDSQYQEFESQADQLLQNILLRYGIKPELYMKLLEEEKSRVHLKKRRGVKEQLRKLIEQSQNKE
jgi:hypothetical protein